MAYVDGMTVKKYLDNNFDQDEIVGRSLGLLVGQVESCKNGGWIFFGNFGFFFEKLKIFENTKILEFFLKNFKIGFFLNLKFLEVFF